MKYIKTFEDLNFELIPNHVYEFKNRAGVFCYIEYNKLNKNFPLLGIEFYHNNNINSHITAYAEPFIDIATPLNITIKDYIINNDMVEKTIEILNNMDTSHYAYSERFKIIKKFKNTLLKDDDIQAILKQNTYNL